jgi:hypothetical protein
MSQNGENRDHSLFKSAPISVQLGPSTSMDLSWMPEDQRRALLTDYAKGVLDIDQKVRELHVNVGALKGTLQTLADTTKDVAEAGNAVTLTQTTAIGRTEVMMGNTSQAQAGKLTKTQTGERDWTPYYIFGGLIALVLVAALIGAH